MKPSDARAQLGNFLESLPEKVFSSLLDRKLELAILPMDIADGYDLAMNETGYLYEGVRRVLAGEDSAANLVAFIEKDQNIEDDNREKIPQIAFEIQTKIFDVVFPLFKQAGLQLKEGRVAAPIQSSQPPISTPATPIPAGSRRSELLSPYAPVPSPIGPSAVRPIGPIRPVAPTSPAAPAIFQPRAGGDGRQPLEEKNIRALTRIAAGTSYTEDVLRASFEDLPQGLRQAISSVDTANAIQEIAKQYLLHVDQMAALASETGLVLLGLTHPAAFVTNLAKRLRLPEARAKEIARDISAKILVRVRDALRGLHVEQPKSGLPAATAQVGLPAATNVAQASLPAVTPARNERTSGAAQAGLPAATNVVQAGVRNPQLTPRVAPSPANRMSPLSPRTAPPATGNTGSVPKVTTPFSPQAKWNLGGASGSPPAPELRRAGKFQVESPTKNAPREESILARQAAEKEESLSREAVLHGIENPDTLKVGSYKLESPREAKPETPVGPTGWRPAGGPSAPAGKEVGSRKYEGSGAIPKPTVEKARPQSESAPPPPKPAQEPQNFLDEKLAGPARLQREERNFTTDPYREPLE